MKLFHSLTPKLIIGSLLLFAVTSGLTFSLNYTSARDAIFASEQEHLKGIATIMAAQVSGDVVEKIIANEENTDQFKKVRSQLYTTRSGVPDIAYSYIMRPAGAAVAFVVDDTYGVEPDAARIGELYVNKENPDRQQLDEQEIWAGMERPSVASEVFSDKWGTFLSGYAPIYNSQGKAVAVLGVDMSVAKLTAKQAYLSKQIYIQLGIIFLVYLLVVSYMAYSLGRDLRAINETLTTLFDYGKKKETAKENKKLDELQALNMIIKDVEGEIWASIGKSTKKEGGPHY